MREKALDLAVCATKEFEKVGEQTINIKLNRLNAVQECDASEA
jgi:hypothetical protein